eukprot:UN30589
MGSILTDTGSGEEYEEDENVFFGSDENLNDNTEKNTTLNNNNNESEETDSNDGGGSKQQSHEQPKLRINIEEKSLDDIPAKANKKVNFQEFTQTLKKCDSDATIESPSVEEGNNLTPVTGKSSVSTLGLSSPGGSGFFDTPKNNKSLSPDPSFSSSKRALAKNRSRTRSITMPVWIKEHVDKDQIVEKMVQIQQRN